VFEPCCGKGGFVLDVVHRFMEGLQQHEPNELKRYKLIVEKCVYFADINPVNIFITRLLLDPKEQYSLLYYEGNTLEIDLGKTFKITSFDLVIGNPPYNSSGSTSTGNTLWNQFVIHSIDNWIGINNYLLFVHPPGWRKPSSSKSKYNNLYKKMTSECHMISLSICDHKQGKAVFHCGTRYDWYLIKKQDSSKKLNWMTRVIDEIGFESFLDLRKFEFLPNFDICKLEKTIGTSEPRCSVLYNRTNYATDNKKWISKEETKEFCYPLVHSTSKSGNSFYYSSRNDNGHFGISKVIFGQTGIADVIIDLKGIYGMTDNAMAILVSSEEEANKLKKVLMSSSFSSFLKACSWSNYRIDWRLFSYFKRNWWNDSFWN
jgi:hypothetical protein